MIGTGFLRKKLANLTQQMRPNVPVICYDSASRIERLVELRIIPPQKRIGAGADFFSVGGNIVQITQHGTGARD